MATNLDRLYNAIIEAHVETEGAIAANAALLGGFVRGAVGTDVELALDGSLLELRSGRARGRIPKLAAGDFPELCASRAANLLRDRRHRAGQVSRCSRVTRSAKKRGGITCAASLGRFVTAALKCAPLTVASCR